MPGCTTKKDLRRSGIQRSFAKEVRVLDIAFEKASCRESTKGFVSVAKRWPGRAVLERNSA